MGVFHVFCDAKSRKASHIDKRENRKDSWRMVFTPDKQINFLLLK